MLSCVHLCSLSSRVAFRVDSVVLLFVLLWVDPFFPCSLLLGSGAQACSRRAHCDAHGQQHSNSRFAFMHCCLKTDLHFEPFFSLFVLQELLVELKEPKISLKQIPLTVAKILAFQRDARTIFCEDYRRQKGIALALGRMAVKSALTDYPNAVSIAADITKDWDLHAEVELAIQAYFAILQQRIAIVQQEFAAAKINLAEASHLVQELVSFAQPALRSSPLLL